MKAIDRPFSQIINGNNQFIIPVFQRDYSWTTVECHQLWNDIIAASHGSVGGHFLGSFVYVESSTSAGFSAWLLIDGQQRLTSLTLLLTALRDHLSEIQWDGDDPTPVKIDAYFLKNEHEAGDKRYKLVLRRHDNETLKRLVDGSVQGDTEQDSRLIKESYDYFRDMLRSSGNDLEDIYRGIGRLNVVDVTLSPETDNPQLIFESLNSTGVDLTQSDLIRNYLLMGLPEEDQTRLYNDYWSSIETDFRIAGGGQDAFLRDYVALRQKSTTQARADKIYIEFKRFWPISDTSSTVTLLQDMTRFARFYASFLRPSMIQNKSISSAMTHVRSGGVGNTHAGLVMRLYDHYDRGLISEGDFVEALTLIKSYLIRRSVIGLQTRGYWSVFMRIAHLIEDHQAIQSLQIAFAQQSTNYRFPDDLEFLTALQERKVYELNICHHILDCLENFQQREPSPTGTFSIEHIMPQSIDDVQEWQNMLGDDWKEVHDTWLHRLGNLTFTAYNSTYSNRPFEEKKTIPGGFNQSAVRLNNFVRLQTHWTSNEIAERGRILSKLAEQIWPNNKPDESLILNKAIEELQNRAARQDSSSLVMRDSLRSSLTKLQESVRLFGVMIEVIENKSVCFYDGYANFFAEMLPMSNYIRLLLPLDFDEIDDPQGLAWDATLLKFLPNATHRDCGVAVDITEEIPMEPIIAMARQAFETIAET